jgi:hypothetical protein
MSQSGSGQPEAGGTYPYGLRMEDADIAGDGIGAPSDESRGHEERRLDDVPDGFGGWGAAQESWLPPDWPDQGVFLPAPNDGAPSWDASFPSTPPYGTPRHHGPRGLLVRLAIIMVLLILVAAIAFAALARSHTIRIFTADNPAAAASPPSLSVTAGAKNGRNGRTRRLYSAAAELPGITKAEAERVLATYWRQNNIANELRSGTLLAAIEGGGSYQMDVGTYRMDRATDPANNDYSAFEAEDAVYYIPREPSGVYPHWFVVRITYTDLASPWHATGTGYVLFAQAAKGAGWKNVLEPYLLTGSGLAPFVETDAEGYAIEASLNNNDPNLSVPPGQIQQVTAASLDGAPGTVKDPGNLADLQNEAYFRTRLPDGSTVTDRHYASGPVLGLRTAGGGALMFYGLTARLSLAPPPGETFELGIPGYYSPSQALTSATVMYVDQFAAYIPHGPATPRIVADASGIAG